MLLVRKLFMRCFLLLVLLFPWYAIQSVAQDTFKIEDAMSILEEKHEVAIFYDAGWFKQGFEIDAGILEMSLPDALYRITFGHDLSVLFFTGNAVLFPRDARVDPGRDPSSERIVIGNTMEMGRHPRVDVTGRVLDGRTLQPVVGAALYSFATGSGVTTDADGNFSWRIPAGEHRLRITSMGYEDAYYQVLAASEGHVEFQLFEEALELGMHTIVAHRAEANIASPQMSVIRLDARTLKELPGSLGEGDIIRSFTLLPGIQSVGEFGTGFHVRGGSADQNLVLVEDVPLFNASHLFGLVSVVNPDMVTSVSLQKAGIPARYGERASSVVDIRKSGVQAEETRLTGGIGLLYSRAHLETPLFNDNVRISVGGRSSYSNWLLEKMPDPELMNSEADFYDISAVLTVNISPKHSLNLFGYQSRDDFNQMGETGHQYISRLSSLRWDAAITPSLFSRLMFGYSDYYNMMEELEEYNPQNAFRLENEIRYQSAKWHLDYESSNSLTLAGGLQGILYDVEPGRIMPLGDESYIRALSLDTERGLEMAVYLSAAFDLMPELRLEAGLRLNNFRRLGQARVLHYDEDRARHPDHVVDTTFFDKNQVVWSHFGPEPRISLRYLFNDASSAKISYNRNHQYINLLSATAVMTPTDLWHLSNPHAGPLISDQLALGYYRNFKDHTIETSVEVYFRNMQNILEYRSGAVLIMNEHPETDLVNAKGYNMGAEFYVNKKTGRLTGWLSYTLSTSKRRTTEEFASHQINNNSYFPSSFDRPHNFVLNANYHISRRWRFNATFNYSTGRPITLPELVFNYQGHQAIHYSDRNKYRLPDYHRLDIAITFGENLRLNRRGKGSWTFSIINVYGRKNPFSVFYKQDLPHADNDNREYSMFKLYIIGRPLPTITYNFSF